MIYDLWLLSYPVVIYVFCVWRASVGLNPFLAGWRFFIGKPIINDKD